MFTWFVVRVYRLLVVYIGVSTSLHKHIKQQAAGARLLRLLASTDAAGQQSLHQQPV